MMQSWLTELYSNVKWQTMMAKPTSDCQLPTNLSVTTGIQSDTFSSMTTVFVGSVCIPPNPQVYPLSFPDRQISIRGQGTSFTDTVLCTSNLQQFFRFCWIYNYKRQSTYKL